MTFKPLITRPMFRYSIERLMNEVLRALGVTKFKAECLLVGARISERQNQNDVCIEPKNGKWNIVLFDTLFDSIEMEINLLQNMFCDHEPTTRDQSEYIRQDSVLIAVQKAIKAYDSEHCVQSFAGRPALVNDYYVTPVIYLPSALFECFRPLQELIIKHECSAGFHASFIHAAVSEVLAEAYDELLRPPDPGRFVCRRSRSSNEIIRCAAVSFMQTPGVGIRDINFWGLNLLKRFNMISSLMYEKTKGVGKLLLANLEEDTVDFLIKFAQPVSFDDQRWARKILQLSSSGTPLIANCKEILGLGHVAAGIDPWESQNIFQIDFLDQYHWRLSCGEEVMLVSKHGVPSLPQETFPSELVLDTYLRLFPQSCKEDRDYFDQILKIAAGQQHGSMLMIAEDAASEAYRLQGEGTRIEPAELTPDLYKQVSRIDGAVLIDPHGLCHGIGVILDGQSGPNCTPSRGARYNSAIRYINSSDQSRLAIVISDDQTIDFIPPLRRRIKRSVLENAVSELEAATSKNYYQPIEYLHSNRFYLNQKQCDRINKVLERIQSEVREVHRIKRRVCSKFSPYPACSRFSPDPDFNESYYVNEN